MTPVARLNASPARMYAVSSRRGRGVPEQCVYGGELGRADRARQRQQECLQGHGTISVQPAIEVKLFALQDDLG